MVCYRQQRAYPWSYLSDQGYRLPLRQGHGHVPGPRAEHICLTDPVVIFDCTECNHRFHYGDVAADVLLAVSDWAWETSALP